MSRDTEAIYDAEIAPLMAEILRIAKAHDMPLYATFQLTDEDSPLWVTSAWEPAWAHPTISRLLGVNSPPLPTWHMTVATGTETQP